MEASNNLEYCMSLGNEFKLSETSTFNFQSSFTKENLAKASIDSLDVQTLFENCNSEIVYVQKPSEVFKSECSTGIAHKLLRRTSLMKLFDPLHSIQPTMKVNDDCNNIFNMGERTEHSTDMYASVFQKEIVNKTKSNNFMDETLISLESPKKVAQPLVPKALFSENIKPVKKYTQEEFCQAMKLQELNLQREFSQKLFEYEANCPEESRGFTSELSKLVAVNGSYRVVLSEILSILKNMKTCNRKNQTKLEDLHVSNEKLKINIKATKEDSCNMENAFADIYKRYEISKGMIKNYKANEKNLIKNIDSVQLALDEQESMNVLLKSRIDDLTDKAEKEIDSAKKSADTQIMILEAQLKKCEIKIASLERDLKQARSNSDKFGSIYDDLMEKFGA